MHFRRPKPMMKRYNRGERILLWDHALKQWHSATVIGYEQRAEGLYELLYVRRDGAKHKEGHIPNEDNFREGGAQLPLFDI